MELRLETDQISIQIKTRSDWFRISLIEVVSIMIGFSVRAIGCSDRSPLSIPSSERICLIQTNLWKNVDMN
jgi:hypothetical protein